MSADLPGSFEYEHRILTGTQEQRDGYRSIVDAIREVIGLKPSLNSWRDGGYLTNKVKELKVENERLRESFRRAGVAPGHGQRCEACGKETNDAAGDPSLWSTWVFSGREAPDHVAYYHASCLGKVVREGKKT